MNSSKNAVSSVLTDHGQNSQYQLLIIEEIEPNGKDVSNDLIGMAQV